MEYWQNVATALDNLGYCIDGGGVPHFMRKLMCEPAPGKCAATWLDLEYICRTHGIDVRSEYLRIVP